MLRVQIHLDPHADLENRRTLATVDIVNLSTAGSMRRSSDYAWRVLDASGGGVNAMGWLVDQMPLSSVDLLARVLDEWRSGRSLPISNHGTPAMPEDVTCTAAEYWDAFDLHEASS